MTKQIQIGGNRHCKTLKLSGNMTTIPIKDGECEVDSLQDRYDTLHKLALDVVAGIELFGYHSEFDVNALKKELCTSPKNFLCNTTK